MENTKTKIARLEQSLAAATEQNSRLNKLIGSLTTENRSLKKSIMYQLEAVKHLLGAENDY